MDGTDDNKGADVETREGQFSELEVQQPIAHLARERESGNEEYKWKLMGEPAISPEYFSGELNVYNDYRPRFK